MHLFLRYQAALRRLVEYRATQSVSARPSLKRSIDAYVSASNSTGCSNTDYWTLYSMIRRLRPKRVLELGTGISTVVIAIALAENEAEGGPTGHITSMEESPEWFDLAKRVFPKEHLGRTDIVLSPTILDGHGVFRGMRYRDVPELPYDFVFVDGPGYRLPDGDIVCDLDLVKVLSNANEPVAALIDKRVSTVFVLQQLLGCSRVRYDAIRGVGIVQPSRAADLHCMDRKAPSKSFAVRFGAVNLTSIR